VPALVTGVEVDTVSCASPGNCGAVGDYRVLCQGTRCPDQRALVVSEVNGAWGNAEEIPGTATLNLGNDAGTNSVSCTSVGKCSAGGCYAASSSFQQAFVVSEH